MRRPFKKSDISFITMCVFSDIPPHKIAKDLNRTVGSIERKIQRLGLVYPCKKDFLDIKLKIKEFNRKRAEQLKSEKEMQFIEQKKFFSSSNYLLGDRWKDALKLTKAEIRIVKGQQVIFLKGKPSGVFEILKMYEEIIKSKK